MMLLHLHEMFENVNCVLLPCVNLLKLLKFFRHIRSLSLFVFMKTQKLDNNNIYLITHNNWVVIYVFFFVRKCRFLLTVKYAHIATLLKIKPIIFLNRFV